MYSYHLRVFHAVAKHGGYARAARMIDQLEARGYIGAFDGSTARVVLRRDDGPGPDEDGNDE